MPITPQFQLSQSATYVTVEIRVPHVRVNVDSVEIVVENSTVHFSSPPYLLMLTFPAPFLEDAEQECAKYDPLKEGGTIILKLAKQEPAMWPDLDLMGALLTPKTPTRAVPSIQVMSESLSQDDKHEDSYTLEQENLSDIRNDLRPHYGFLNMHAGVFTDLAREGLAAEMLQLVDPDNTPPEDRRALRLEKEVDDFDTNRYLGDLNVQDDYIYQTAMDMTPHWQLESGSDGGADVVNAVSEQLSELSTFDTHEKTQRYTYFTFKESTQLASIPYPLLPTNISSENDESLLLGLLDILFAYVYDHIMTDGDPTIESSWTVCILSSTLSWLDTFQGGDSLELVVRHCIRRALIYPYLRNYEVAMHCWNQVCCILRNGRRCIVRCLLQVHNILDKSECHYLGNRLYVDPYLAWMQRHVTDAQVSSLCNQLQSLLEKAESGEIFQKEHLGLNLLELERQLDEEYADSDDNSGSESDEESSNEEESSSDDSCASSKDSNANVPCENDQTTHSKELLDSNLWCASVAEGMDALQLSEAADGLSKSKPLTKNKLIEELS